MIVRVFCPFFAIPLRYVLPRKVGFNADMGGSFLQNPQFFEQFFRRGKARRADLTATVFVVGVRAARFHKRILFRKGVEILFIRISMGGIIAFYTVRAVLEKPREQAFSFFEGKGDSARVRHHGNPARRVNAIHRLLGRRPSDIRICGFSRRKITLVNVPWE